MNETPNPHETLGPDESQIARMRTGIHAQIAADTTTARRRRNWTIGSTLAALVLVAGGTSAALASGVINAPSWLTFAAAPAPTPAVATPTAAPTPSPSATPTPPSAAPVAQTSGTPQPRVQLSCDQLVAPTDRAALLGPGSETGDGADLPFQPGSSNALDQLIEYDARVQLGQLTCPWIAADSGEVLYVTVAPNDTVVPDDPTSSSEYTTVAAPAFGPDARFRLAPDGGTDDAELDIPTETRVLTIELRNAPSDPSGTTTEAQKALSALAPRLLSRLSAAPPDAPPYSPAGRVDFSCGSLASTLTAMPGTGIFQASTDPYASLSQPEFHIDGGVDCGYTHRDASGQNPVATQLRYLPGGVWDRDLISSMDTGELSLLPASGLGDEARAGCVPGAAQFDLSPQCWVQVFVNGSWLDVEADTADRSIALGIARSVLAALGD